MSQNHIIKKQVLDITLDSEIGSFSFQNMLSTFFRTDILSLIDRYCNEMSDASTIFRIDKLEIDLGEIDQDNFQIDFKRKISEIFPQKLSQALSSGDVYTSPVYENRASLPYTITKENKDFELLDFFIKKGRLPWWVKKGEFYDIPMLLETQIKAQPQKIKAMIYDIAPNNNQIKRLVYYSRDPVLEKIIALIQGIRYRDICKILKDLTSALTTSDLLHSENTSKIRSELWVSIVALCAASKKQIFQHEHILHTVAEHLSEAFHTNYNTLYIYIAKEMKAKGYDVNDKPLSEGITNTHINEYLNQLVEIENLLQELIYDVVRERGNVPIYYRKLHEVDTRVDNKTDNELDKKNKKQKKRGKGFEQIFDKWGSDPVNNRVLKEKTVELEKCARRFQEYCEKLYLEKPYLELRNSLEKGITHQDKGVVQKLSKSIEIIKKELTEISKLIFDILHVFIKQIDNETIYYRKPHEVNIESDNESIEKQGKRGKSFEHTFDKRVFDPVNNLLLKEKTDELERRGETFQEYCKKLYSELRDIFEKKRADQDNALVKKLGNSLNAIKNTPLTHAFKTLHEQGHTFDDSEEIYINNAGIVLLWPYLNPFFNTVGLVENQQFVDEDKKERAVLLLHYLASGLRGACEYEVMLNKILCGIDQDTPLTLLVEFSEKEINECENLLKAVIQNWPALKNVSVRGFREMFLVREGIISVRDGRWVMRIEEKAYDVLIDKMPWSISTIKLPWMTDLLFVEWRL
ncbi:MAG: contractile injection system tape measure protein [bacterium]